MSNIEWTKGPPTFTDPIEWWRVRTSMEKRPFVVEVGISSRGSRRMWFPGLANPVPVADLPADYLWGGRIDMGELPESVDVQTPAAPVPPPGWEFDPDCEPTPTGEPWTAETWARRWPPSMCNSFHLRDDGSVAPWLQEFVGLDGKPLWRSVFDEWWRIETSEGNEHLVSISTPVGPLLPIRKVKS